MTISANRWTWLTSGVRTPNRLSEALWKEQWSAQIMTEDTMQEFLRTCRRSNMFQWSHNRWERGPKSTFSMRWAKTLKVRWRTTGSHPEEEPHLKAQGARCRGSVSLVRRMRCRPITSLMYQTKDLLALLPKWFSIAQDLQPPEERAQESRNPQGKKLATRRWGKW